MQNFFPKPIFNVLCLKISRTSRLQMLFTIGVLKNFAILTGKHLCWSLFLLKLQAIQVFSWECCEIFTNSFFYRTPLVAAFEYLEKRQVDILLKILQNFHLNLAFCWDSSKLLCLIYSLHVLKITSVKWELVTITPTSCNGVPKTMHQQNTKKTLDDLWEKKIENVCSTSTDN